MHLSDFRLIAPPPTSFHSDGSLNLDAVAPLADRLAQDGVDGVFVAGSTGECSSLTTDERQALSARWVEAARATDLEVIVQVGSSCQADARQLAAHAQEIGGDAIAAHAPSYLKPSNVQDLIDFLAPVAAAAGDLPFYFYDIPGVSNVSLPAADFLASGKQRIPNLAGLKYSHTDLQQLQRCVELNDGEFQLLFGCDQALLAGVVLGVGGAVGSTYNFAAPWYRQMIAMLEAGDLEGARRRQAQAAAWVEMMAPFGFLAACKAVMEMRGIACGPVRPPLGNLSAGQRSELEKRVEETGLLECAAQTKPLMTGRL